MNTDTYIYNIEKYRRNHNFNLEEINTSMIINSARDECACRVIGKMVIGENFYVNKTKNREV